MVRANIIFSGTVQGVGFRFTVQRYAIRLGLKGWVRNTPDGCVEAVFEGEEENINRIIEWCHQGSTHSKVKNVEIKYQEPKNEFSDFTIKF